MSELLRFFKDMRDNGYGLAEIAAQLGTSAIAEPVAGFAAMYDPANGAQAIREGMTYQPRTQAGQMYQQGAARTLGTIAKPAMPVIDTWQRGVDIAGGYSPVAGAALRTVPAAIGVAMGAKPALQAGRQVSESLGAMQARMIANANAPRTLNTGYMGQRGAIGTQRPLTEFEQAHLTAQRNAALPVNQGGLGLPADNTAMDRARAMGWDTDVYHGTDVDISEFDISRAGEKMKKDWGDASYHAPDTSSANYYATESGAKLAKDKAFKNYEAVEASEIAKGYKGHGWNQTLQDALKEYRKAAALAKETPTGANVIPLMLNTKNAEKYIVQSGMTDPYLAENLNMAKRGKDVAIIMNNPETVSEFAVFDPKKIRSRFAAFDPMQRQSSNLLATTAPLVPATALGAYMYNENRKKSQGNQ